jgi:hypothetical protein
MFEDGTMGFQNNAPASVALFRRRPLAGLADSQSAMTGASSTSGYGDASGDDCGGDAATLFYDLVVAFAAPRGMVVML